MKVAVIGTGISGSAVSYLLQHRYDVTVYEANQNAGGHSRTVTCQVASGELISVDTGFIVYNELNYPLLTALFKHLNVRTECSDMSFGISVDSGRLEYSTLQLRYLFAQKINLFRPDFWRMLSDIMRFNRQALQDLDNNIDMTLGQYIDKLKLGHWFRQYYLLAMGGAIWSTPLTKMYEFPAKTFIRFFANHGLLTVNQQPQWRTVSGGSKNYVEKLVAVLGDSFKLNCAVTKVERANEHVTVYDSHGQQQIFDHVIFACHADQALDLLSSPTPQEQRTLGCFKYQTNNTVLHSDIQFMPKRKKAWASWVYLADKTTSEKPLISLSYWMNNLQNLNVDTPIIVTLNPRQLPQTDKIYDQHSFRHPIFNQQAIDAQSNIPDIQGKDRIWYCGAYQRYGFHEDGLYSAINVAKQMDVMPPWS